ncbi:Histidine phosphatase superfamily (branch 1) [Acinetobacter boissieri]|uniref:Histidine phosphatase superfamily (Branch 1) n=1 Tax=Acinetobacter boissieri TaxID=1219383 RepID=A0A1G6JCJ8_9GAMM|nr:Histidine phosphatase superfamily (branch 1) [Acinetobacter boissieri]
MAIFLIRHAQSEANIDERTQSHADIVLTELEWQQAQALVDRLPCIQQLMISKYICTSQTAQGIVQRDDVSPEINSYIHEFSYLSAKKCENTNMQDRKTCVDAYWHRMDYDYRY